MDNLTEALRAIGENQCFVMLSMLLECFQHLCQLQLSEGHFDHQDVVWWMESIVGKHYEDYYVKKNKSYSHCISSSNNYYNSIEKFFTEELSLAAFIEIYVIVMMETIRHTNHFNQNNYHHDNIHSGNSLQIHPQVLNQEYMFVQVMVDVLKLHVPTSSEFPQPSMHPMICSLEYQASAHFHHINRAKRRENNNVGQKKYVYRNDNNHHGGDYYEKYSTSNVTCLPFVVESHNHHQNAENNNQVICNGVAPCLGENITTTSTTSNSNYPTTTTNNASDYHSSFDYKKDYYAITSSQQQQSMLNNKNNHYTNQRHYSPPPPQHHITTNYHPISSPHLPQHQRQRPHQQQQSTSYYTPNTQQQHTHDSHHHQLLHYQQQQQSLYYQQQPRPPPLKYQTQHQQPPPPPSASQYHPHPSAAGSRPAVIANKKGNFRVHPSIFKLIMRLREYHMGLIFPPHQHDQVSA